MLFVTLHQEYVTDMSFVLDLLYQCASYNAACVVITRRLDPFDRAVYRQVGVIFVLRITGEFKLTCGCFVLRTIVNPGRTQVEND